MKVQDPREVQNADEIETVEMPQRLLDETATRRTYHLVSLLPTSELVSTIRKPIGYRVYLEAAGMLAMKHFNERNPRVLPHLPDIIGDCNVELTMEMRDTQFSPIYAARQLQEILYRPSEDGMKPIALVGAARSAVSQTLSILAGVYELPQISASSTSAALDLKDSSPFFARTVPTNKDDAKAIILYLDSLGVTHLGVIFIRDAFGTVFHSSLLEEAYAFGIQIESTSYDEDTRSIKSAIQTLRQSGLSYFFGIFNPGTWKEVVREASKAGIVGEGKVWLLSDASLELTQPGFHLDRDTEADLAAAIDGTGVITLTVDPNAAFEEALSEFETDAVLQKEFVDTHVDPSAFEGYDFAFEGTALYQYLNYDAVMALGLAACGAPEPLFTGPELYKTLVETEFVGVSGYVRFSNTTGTRDEEGLKYRVENVRLALNQTPGSDFSFQTQTAVLVDLADTNPIQTITDFHYFGGSVRPPLSLPELEVDMNPIPTGVRVTGLTLGALTMLCAALWLAWTAFYRNIDVVRVAQPVFLGQLCIGAFIMASAVIPMSMQEPTSQQGLNVACMFTPWLISIGFVTAFSALFSKTWRLNKLFQSGVGFRRIKVEAKDVIRPFLALMLLNVTLLSIWTGVAPLQWSQVNVMNFDQYGRSVESYGTCYSQGSDPLPLVFVALIALVDVAALVIALYQSYKARNLPTDFNESFYIWMTTASLLEALVLGAPLLLLVHDSPTADFLVKSILVTIICMTILLPMFVPKYLQRNMRALRISLGRSSKHIAAGGTSRRSMCGTLAHKEGRDSDVSRRSLDEGSTVLVAGQTPVTRSEDYYVERNARDQAVSKRRLSSIAFRSPVEDSLRWSSGSSSRDLSRGDNPGSSLCRGGPAPPPRGSADSTTRVRFRHSIVEVCETTTRETLPVSSRGSSEERSSYPPVTPDIDLSNTSLPRDSQIKHPPVGDIPK